MTNKKVALLVVAALFIGALAGGAVSEKLRNNQKSDAATEKVGKKDRSGLEKLEIDKPYTVQTEEGSYTFTIHSVYRTDWMSDDRNEVLVLSYEVENIDYNPENGSLLLLDANTFHMEDVDGNEFEAWDSTMSENGFPDFVEAGEKKEQEQPYVALKGTKKVNIIYQNQGEEKAVLTLDVQDSKEGK